MRFRLMLVLAAVAVVFSAGMVMADDFNTTLHFADFTPQTYIHDDLAPYKGWAYFMVYNDTDVAWTNFELSVFSVNGSNISATVFIDSPSIYLPTSSQSGLTWAINNNPAGGSMALYFASDQVNPGDSAWFKIYTDNTTYKQRFGLSIYPTVAPEPSGLVALAGSLIGFLGWGLRKRF